MRRVLVVPVLLAALVLGTAACGRDPVRSPGAGASPSASGAGSAQRFASCMRDHGQNVPDPDPNSGSIALAPPAGGDQAAWNAAMQACQQYLPGGGAPAAPDFQQLEGLRQYAACMRQHGIELTDPDPSTGKSQLQGRLAHASRQQLMNDPTYKTADAACEDKLTDGTKPEGGGK